MSWYKFILYYLHLSAYTSPSFIFIPGPGRAGSRCLRALSSPTLLISKLEEKARSSYRQLGSIEASFWHIYFLPNITFELEPGSDPGLGKIKLNIFSNRNPYCLKISSSETQKRHDGHSKNQALALEIDCFLKWKKII